jgi:hypothetical protein
MGSPQITHGIVDIPQFKERWLKLIDTVNSIPEPEKIPSEERLEADKIACEF